VARNRQQQQQQQQQQLVSLPQVLEAMEAATPTCEACRHWQPVMETLLTRPTVGRCRRYPPGIISPSDLCATGPLCKFPVTRATDACGEHQPRP
jgi:hypothetical protein